MIGPRCELGGGGRCYDTSVPRPSVAGAVITTMVKVATYVIGKKGLVWKLEKGNTDSIEESTDNCTLWNTEVCGRMDICGVLVLGTTQGTRAVLRYNPWMHHIRKGLHKSDVKMPRPIFTFLDTRLSYSPIPPAQRDLTAKYHPDGAPVRFTERGPHLVPSLLARDTKEARGESSQ